MHLDKNKGSRKSEYIALTVILAFALFIRLYALGTPSLWVDESISALASKAILAKGLPIFDSGFFYSRAFVFHYMQSFFVMFGSSDFSLRLVSVLFGVLTVFLGYKIGKEYSPSAGIIVALFMSVFYLEVFFSRQARMYQMFQFFFFLSIFLLYKSKENDILIWPALLSLFITIDSQALGIVLAPFFIISIFRFQKNKSIALLPLILIILAIVLWASDSFGLGFEVAQNYSRYFTNMVFLLVLSFIGAIFAFKKNKRLTFTILAPSVLLLIGVLSLYTFALRYIYFFVFPLVLYSSLLFSFLYEKYGKYIILSVLIILIIPSNIIYPQTYVNVIRPLDYGLNDASSPVIDYKSLPQSLKEDMGDSVLITYFSPELEWYVKKPDYVVPFSLDGKGLDQISYNSTKGIVDVYSGSPILSSRPNVPYYISYSSFSESKLKSDQGQFLKTLISNCILSYSDQSLKIYRCVE